MKREKAYIKLEDATDVIITIIHGDKCINFLKEQLESYVFFEGKKLFDTTKLGSLNDDYYNAFEWILANLYRIIGIQLYNDGEIRLNIIPSQIVDGKKCIFLKLDSLRDRSMDNALYLCLFNLLYGQPINNIKN